ncbi:DNA-binding transcriptional regulator YiaG [Novosphingobium sp. SG751A]|uniref:helix-turn-helix domain-containing protein n=1 Tax=Novosphingobium sp. SG751A TaxID=2587000 RepID=UPI001551FA2C|nr:helix-turn-helix transcriptional regulator [Novosphingobium sp. SG751A]NOW44139.1 DNA-binding transcriptional regulator YiaG [Novosphingobium sp. SG751A]
MNTFSRIADSSGYPVTVRAGQARGGDYVRSPDNRVMYVLKWNGVASLDSRQDLDSFLDEVLSLPDVAEHLEDVSLELAEAFARSAGGETLRSLRIRSGLSQTQLGVLLGTSQAAVSEYERGTRELSYEKLKLLSSSLSVEPNELFRAIENGKA